MDASLVGTFLCKRTEVCAIILLCRRLESGKLLR